jgi:hypothetical protein
VNVRRQLPEPGVCDRCHKPRLIPIDVLSRWWHQAPPARFVPLAELLADYCACEDE